MTLAGAPAWQSCADSSRKGASLPRLCLRRADEEWLNTDPHKGRPEAYSLDEAAAYYEHESRWLTGLVLVDREVLLGSGFVWA